MSTRKIAAVFVGFLAWWVAARLIIGALASLAAGRVTNRLAPAS